MADAALQFALQNKAVIIACTAAVAVYADRRSLLTTLGLLPPAGTVAPLSTEGMPGERVKLSAGHVHVVDRFGAGSSQAPQGGRKFFVLVHGYSTASHLWDHMQNDLCNAGHRVIRYDLYGRGWSDAPDGPQNTALFVSQLAELLLAVGCRHHTGLPANKPCLCGGIELVGLSMGTVIACEFTARYPHLVRSLTLSSPAGPIHNHGAGPRFINNSGLLGEVLFQATGVEKVGNYTNTMTGYPDNSAERKALARRTEDEYSETFKATVANHPGYLRSLRQTVGEFGWADNREAFRAAGSHFKSVLVFWGTEDDVTPITNIKHLRGCIPHAEVVTLEGASHWAVIEAHDEIVPRLLAHAAGATRKA